MWTCWSKCEVHHSWRRVQNTKLGSPCESLSEVTGVPLFVRNVVSCCRLKATVEAVTRWTATSCARAAAHAASRTSRPKSPPTANKSLPEPPRSRPHRSTDSRHIIDSSLFTHSERKDFHSVENRYFYFLLTSVRLLPLHFLYSLVHRL